MTRQNLIHLIQKECLTAWHEFYEADAKNTPAEKNFNLYNIRDFYDYFDKLGIFIVIDSYEYEIKKLECRKFEGWLLFDGDMGLKNIRLEPAFNSRVEAELNAFYEAFKIREGQLEGKK